MTDATEATRMQASSYPNVDEGTSCAQSSFKKGGKAALFIGEQGGRHNSIFKLKQSRPEAEDMAIERPQDFQVGSGAWITAGFSGDKPLPKALWQRWLDESYALSQNRTREGLPADC